MKGAKIWTQINVRASGVKQLSVWISPGMHDFSRPLLLRVNSTQVGSAKIIPANPAVMLEDFYLSGDRQRLFYAKIDMKL